MEDDKIMIIMIKKILLICTYISTMSHVKHEIDIFNYDEYMNKIWIPIEWSGTNVGEVDTDLISFCITNIDNGVIEGKIATDFIADPSFDLRSFSGTMKNGLGECQFVDKLGNARSFQLALMDGELITVELQHMRDGKLLTEKVDYKPYNLSDIAAPVTINTIVEADLNLWGNVQIAGGRFDTTRKYYGVVYLINENRDFLYHLRGSFRTGAEIVEVSTGDINGDGLTDIKVIERFEADDIDDAEWIFLQREDGYFEDGYFERWITKNP